jgi:hypothetical protein
VELTRGEGERLEAAPAVCGAVLPLAARHAFTTHTKPRSGGFVAAAVAVSAAAPPLSRGALHMPRVAWPRHTGAAELALPDVTPLLCGGDADADADARLLRVRVSVLRWSTAAVAPLWRALTLCAALADADAVRRSCCTAPARAAARATVPAAPPRGLRGGRGRRHARHRAAAQRARAGRPPAGVHQARRRRAFGAF